MTDVVDLRAVLRGKQLLIFDFDGTLADTSPLHAAAFSETLHPLGITIHYPDIAGLKTTDAMRRCLTIVGREFTEADIAALTAAKQRRVRELIERSLEPLPGVDEFLRWARPRYRLAIYTSGSRGTVSLALKKLGYTEWFDPMVFGEDVQHGKPDPEGFLKILNLTQASPKAAMVFEDSTSGIESAKASQMEVIDIQTIAFSSIYKVMQGQEYGQ
ncbi:HAD family hydrolase [Candidatus Competibacter phosphatis]|uniref:HAD family hydrolase n=1 Tax=Candidatus Competibacter phosphatis TaxID=221280 RepID=A0ABX1TMM7_9GAMM|nr:HAD-IA family hydrolase [Candidatus Competibacter phosphatis]NMQ20633.1 HAD family hydrolase [Candidatus Competibacter phosphatis]